MNATIKQWGWIPPVSSTGQAYGVGKDRISYKVKCKRKKEKGTGIATGCALAMTEEGGGKDRERTGYRGQGIGWRDKRKCKVQKRQRSGDRGQGAKNQDCHGLRPRNDSGAGFPIESGMTRVGCQIGTHAHAYSYCRKLYQADIGNHDASVNQSQIVTGYPITLFITPF